MVIFYTAPLSPHDVRTAAARIHNNNNDVIYLECFGKSKSYTRAYLGIVEIYRSYDIYIGRALHEAKSGDEPHIKASE